MCKEVGAFPKCTCPDFVAPDSTPGVMTWDELLEHMDNLSEWGHGELKAWTAQARSMAQISSLRGKDLRVQSPANRRMSHTEHRFRTSLLAYALICAKKSVLSPNALAQTLLHQTPLLGS